MRDPELFEAQLLEAQNNLSERYYDIAVYRAKGKNIFESFSANTHLIGILVDNQISKFLTIQQSNLILDKLEHD